MASALVAWIVASSAAAQLPTTAASASERRASRAALAMFTRLYLPDVGFFLGYTPSVDDPQPPLAELWGYSWALASLEDVARLRDGERYLPLARRVADNLEAYWDAGAPLPGYAPTPYPLPGALKYYDDNAWAGLDLVAAFELTGGPGYLARAERVFAFEQSGWDPKAGGIYWNEQRETRNTAANAPAAELAARLYLDTRDRRYLVWAERIFAWQERWLVDPKTGEVWDSVDDEGNVLRDDWTYNQGAVIGAAILLYRATHQTAYLRQAHRTLDYVVDAMVRPDGTLVPPAEFGGVLANDLWLEYDVTRDPAARRIVGDSASVAWRQARSPQGLFAGDWAGPPPKGAGVLLLSQSAAVRLLAADAAIRAQPLFRWPLRLALGARG